MGFILGPTRADLPFKYKYPGVWKVGMATGVWKIGMATGLYQQADSTFQTLVATGRPGRDVGPSDRHTYPTDHVHAQRKRGRHGRGG